MKSTLTTPALVLVVPLADVFDYLKATGKMGQITLVEKPNPPAASKVPVVKKH